MRFTISLCLLMLLLVGCDPMAFRRVSVSLPAASAQESVSVSAERAVTQDALHVVDSVVAPHGLVRSTQLSTNQPALIAAYFTPSGPQNPMIGCRVFCSDDKFDVIFSEFGKIRSSQTVRQMCDELVVRFGGLYGTNRVTVGR